MVVAMQENAQTTEIKQWRDVVGPVLHVNQIALTTDDNVPKIEIDLLYDWMHRRDSALTGAISVPAQKARPVQPAAKIRMVVTGPNNEASEDNGSDS
jgi:hypothetical protein